MMRTFEPTSRRKRAGPRRVKISVLERLTAEEARDVLDCLLEARPDLATDAEKVARSLLGEVTFEAIAHDVEEAVCALDLDHLNRRAGRHRWGYVGPTEAAWEILDETAEPFVEDIRRRINLGLEAEALEICTGMVLGLYRVEQGKRGELAQWAPDFPAEAACRAIETWLGEDLRMNKIARALSRRNRPSFPRKFTQMFNPEWRNMIARSLSRKR